MSYGNRADRGWGIATQSTERREEKCAGRGQREPWAVKSFGLRSRCHQPAPIHWSHNPIASAYVRWDMPNIRKQSVSGKRRNVLCTGNTLGSERFQHHKQHDDDHGDCRYLVDYPIEFLRMPITVGGKIFHPAGQQSVHDGEQKKKYRRGAWRTTTV